MAQAISYIRFSSALQRGGSSTDRQSRMIADWLKAHPDVSLSPISASDEGRSGFSGAHLQHGLGQILAAIEDGKIATGDFILIEAMDRLGRLPPLEMLSLLQRIVGAGVNVVTLEDSQTYSKESLNEKIGDLFILVGKISQAHEYSKNLSRRMKAAYESKRQKAKDGETIKRYTPFWLTSDGKIIEEWKEGIERVVEYYLKGWGPRNIVIELVSKNLIPENTTTQSVRKWLRSKALVGSWDNNGDEIENVVDAVIDRETFYRVQTEIKRREVDHSPRSTFKLSGLIKCKECGSSYYITKKMVKGYPQHSAKCLGREKKGADFCSNQKQLPYVVLLHALESYLPEQLSQLAYDSSLDEELNKISALKSERTAIDDQLNVLLDMLLSMPDQSNLKAKFEQLSASKDEIETKIANLEVSLVDRGASVSINSVVMNANMSIDEILSDDTATRETLKKTNWRIIAFDSKFSVNVGSAGNVDYEIVKRRAKFNALYVTRTVPEHEVFNESTDEYDVIEAETEWLAFVSGELVATAQSEDKVENILGEKNA
ncbi:recombinase family protein [Salinicola sp. CPA57]|uniref:recombinase family protein n=1 Tax=Salinicola sp. CPA57 TaxID=1949080 RepID=UPI000DA1DB37|nr:recombinase family protein [Salinicola sp. CPA57]